MHALLQQTQVLHKHLSELPLLPNLPTAQTSSPCLLPPPIGAALFVSVDIVDPVLVELTSALLVGVI